MCNITVMINKDFNSILDLIQAFPNQQSCIDHLEQLRWNGNVVSPFDSESEVYSCKGNKYTCKNTGKYFYVITNTFFDNTKIDLQKWFLAIWLVTSHKKRISSVQLAIDLGITQKTAWFVLHRIREMLREKAPKMLGVNKMVETDATYIGGKESNRHLNKKRSQDDKSLTNEGKPYKAKKTIIGIIERNGNVALKYVSGETTENMIEFVKMHVPQDATIYSDEAPAYKQLKRKYNHDNVKHALNIYVEGQVHTNTIENFWSVLKRGIYGVYHQVSEKHISRYLDEYAARFNNRNKTSNERFNQFLDGSESVLAYKTLIRN